MNDVMLFVMSGKVGEVMQNLRELDAEARRRYNSLCELYGWENTENGFNGYNKTSALRLLWHGAGNVNVAGE